MVGGSPERIYVLYPNVSKSVVTLHDVDIRYQVMICFHFVLDTRFNQFGLKKRHQYLRLTGGTFGRGSLYGPHVRF